MKLHSNRRSYEKRKRLPQNGKTKNPRVMAASLAAIVISAVIFCMVIVIGIFGFASDGKNTESAPNAPVAEGAFHAWFFWNDTMAYNEAGSYEMSGPFVIPEEVGFVPADGIAAVLGGSYTYNEEKGTVKFKDIGRSVKVTVGSKEMRVGFFKKVTLEEEVFVDGETVYIPFRGICEALGYGISYTEMGGHDRLDVFVPDKEKDIQIPTASFTTDKDTYEVGEKIQYDVKSKSPMGYEIVEEKWENMAVWYFESGEVTISYSVKDYKGNWSEPVSRTIAIEGEYHAAEEVPVLSYYYIVEDSSKISKTVKGEVEKKEPDPNDPTKVIVKKEKKDKLVKGPYYGDDMVISLDQLRYEMEYLADEGFHTLTLSEYLAYADSGVMPPENSVLILFVNGYESTYKLAYPLLKELGLKANIAPEVHAAEERSELVAAVAAEEDGAEKELIAFDEDQRFPVVTFDQMKEMMADGTFEVGCISYDSNSYGDNASILAAPVKDETEEDYAKRVQNDVATASSVLGKNLGEDNPFFFVYPYGETSDVLVDAVKGNGFAAAFVKGKDGLLLPDSDRYRLERINITQSMGKYDFRSLVK